MHRPLPCPHRLRRLALLGAGLLVGCNNVPDILPTFDGPDRAAVLHPDDGSPFEEPVGFVANTRSGTIVPLDLKHSTELGDSLASPFLRPRWIATGDTRQLGAVAAFSPDSAAVTVFAADLANDVLLEAPYMTGFDTAPILYEASHDGGVFVDDDGSGDSATLGGVLLRRGFTTTETWSIEYNGTEWWVFGSASGKQGLPAQTDVPYKTDNREVEFTISGSASSGDRIELSTDVGIIEHDLGGPILDIAEVPGEDLLLVGVWDAGADAGELVLWDVVGGAELGRVLLPEGSQPWRFAFTSATADDGGPEVFVADSQRAAVYQVLLDLDDPAASALLELPTDGPVADVAWVGYEGHELDPEDDGYEHLFVALATTNRVDPYDLRTDTWIDVNPLDGVIGGVDLEAPVIGMAGTRDRVQLQERTNWDVELEDKVVAITTFDGDLRLMEGRTGCLAIDEGGPGVSTDASTTSLEFSDRGATSNPLLWEDPETFDQVVFPRCGGVARTETWSLVYQENIGAWEVEGSQSGVLEKLIYEDQRYLSDNGEFSVLILSGTNPTSDGDTFTFQADDGVMKIDDTPRPGSTIDTPFELPARPVVFEYEAGPTGGGWDKVDNRTYVLLPVTNSDLAVRVRLEAWSVEGFWE